MKYLGTIYTAIALICFTAVLAVYDNVLSLFAIQGNPSMTLWVKTVAAIGIYAFLFQFLMFLSDRMIRKLLSSEAKIVGNWYQIFIIYNYETDDKKKKIRHGPVSINFCGDALEITATNLKLDKSSSPSGWYSNKITIDGSQIWLLFSSTGPGRGTTHGNMLYHFQENKPKKLNGQFSDSSPAKHYGSIELFRIESEYKERLKELEESK
ncbi:hypothetical protein MNBD_BACTEROID01-139 [hydrothermal vent metagenome]|uniref:Uncharacterized protein n=1 Tax=hydrothermal vent metagenome TaxID=652676 RepID=A0A3B0THQ4_9ZZZZ